MPEFSIVIPLHNKEDLILRAVDSALAAAGPRDIELVVVDDGSTDEGPALIREKAARDSRIRIVGQQNQGAGAARNRGVKEARAALICFLDADDEWQPNHLEVIEGLVRRYPECGTYGTAHCFAWPGGVIEPLTYRNVPTDPEGGVIASYFRAAESSALWTSAVAMRREVFRKCGGFPTHLSVGQDILCWAAASLVAPVAWSPKVTAIYHREAANYSSRRWSLERHQAIIDAFRALADRPGLDAATRAAIEDHCAYQKDLQVKVAKYAGDDRMAFKALRQVIADRGVWHARWLILRCLVPNRAMAFLAQIKRRGRGLSRT